MDAAPRAAEVAAPPEALQAPAAAEPSPLLQFLAFGDSAELRFPMVLMGVALMGFTVLVEALDGWQRHLDHIVPLTALIVGALAVRARLIRRHPEPLPQV